MSCASCLWCADDKCFVVKLVFFFQAEDGIRDVAVTGVQTCALPILGPERAGDKSAERLQVARRQREAVLRGDLGKVVAAGWRDGHHGLLVARDHGRTRPDVAQRRPWFSKIAK